MAPSFGVAALDRMKEEERTSVVYAFPLLYILAHHGHDVGSTPPHTLCHSGPNPLAHTFNLSTQGAETEESNIVAVLAIY